MGGKNILKRFRPRLFAKLNKFDVNDVVLKKDYDFSSLLSLKVTKIFEKRARYILLLWLGVLLYIIGMFLALDSSDTIKWDAGFGICMCGLALQLLDMILYLVYAIKSANEAELKFNELVSAGVLSSNYDKYSNFIKELYVDKKHVNDPLLKSFAFALLFMKLNDNIYV